MQQTEGIYVDNLLKDPAELMGSSLDQTKFIDYIKNERISAKEITKWYAEATIDDQKK